MGSQYGEEDEKTGGTAGKIQALRWEGASGGGREGGRCVNDDQSLRWSASFILIFRSAILLPLSRMAL